MLFCIRKEEGDQSGNGKMNQSQAGKFLQPPMVWNTKAVKIGWQLKWSLNGIQPQRALVLMVQDVTIPDQKVFLVQ